MNTPLQMDVQGFYWAKRTVSEAGAVTYDTPAQVCGVAKIAAAYTKNNINTYEDGASIFNRSIVSNAKVTLDSHTVPLAKKMELCFGLTAAEDGSFEEGGDTDAPQEGACGYPIKLSDGSYLCTWWYDCTCEPSDESAETSDDSGPKINPESLVFNCVKDPIQRKRRRVAIVENATAMATFFATVLPVASSGG